MSHPAPSFRALAPSPVRAIVASYDSPLITVYTSLRFLILRQTFLQEIDRYLPAHGRILDLGCGFGLFSLFFATTQPGRELLGVDRDLERVEQARRSADKLGLTNVSYHHGDVLEWVAPGSYDAIYMLDVLHHVPVDAAPKLLAQLRAQLNPGGVLILKEVANKPFAKMLFTLALDRLMVGMKEPIHYWEPAQLIGVLENLGFDVKHHAMRDVLPYPHVLYIGRLPTA
ncbi:MAG TPA: class I SAM-dependent methyltransferase [Polyangiales bacterium]|nr:class I SAM-dependent methyltransferase [Polyangiales bacterium]